MPTDLLSDPPILMRRHRSARTHGPAIALIALIAFLLLVVVMLMLTLPGSGSLGLDDAAALIGP